MLMLATKEVDRYGIKMDTKLLCAFVLLFSVCYIEGKVSYKGKVFT